MIKASVAGMDEKELNRILSTVPGLMQAAAFEGGLRPAANVVKRRLKELTPKSKQNSKGGRDKWSAKTRESRGGEKELHQETAVKLLRPKNRSAAALIGYRWPGGNKGHFVIPMKKDTRRQVLWGRDTGKEVRKGDDILKRSLDETRQAASTAFVGGVAKTAERKLRNLPSG